MLAEGRTFAEIATRLGRQLGTVVELICDLVEKGEVEFRPGWVDPGKYAQIQAACARLGFARLKQLKEALPPQVSFEEEIRLVVALLRHREKGGTGATLA